jgi:Ca2+-binding RTX toxin-like protein/beta-glucanase (GH16 family)
MVAAGRGLDFKPSYAGEWETAMAIDLSKYTVVIDDDFDQLNEYDDVTGVWSTTSRREALVTNGPESVFVSDKTKTSDGKGVGLDPLEIKDGVLHIKSGLIPDANKAAVDDALALANQDAYIGKSKYYTGMITTAETWAQTYGYFEIRAQVPEGKGHWPAFWLGPAGEGWPPEIDVFEAYGRGVDKKTGADNTFTTAVFFDKVDTNGNATQDVNIKNPYVEGTPASPIVKKQGGGEQYVFTDKTNAMTEFGADIYDEFWTWSMAWTPETITFYFGKDSDSLVEVYKTPTPEDVNSPMALLANDQIGSTFGWNPVAGYDHLTFAKGNDFKIDYIKVLALNPEQELKAAAGSKGADIVDKHGTTSIWDSAGNDRIVSGTGQDQIYLSGGADTVFIDRGVDGKIISGFGADDRIVLEGFSFDGTEGAMARLTQNGSDVWLINGAAPANPQTIIFKDKDVSDFTDANFEVRWSTTPNVWAINTHNSARLTDKDGDNVVTAVATGSKMTDAQGAATGTKTLVGSTAGDLYYVYSSGTKIVEKATGGVDTVYAYRDFVLPDNVENLVNLMVREGQKMTGNSLGNRLEGFSGGEIFEGGKGDDLIVSGGGADRMVYNPGDGHDTVVGFGSDDVVELRGLRFASFAELQQRLTVSGSDVLLDLGTNQSITFRDTAISALAQKNFVFQQGATNVAGKGIDPYYKPSVSSDGSSYVPPTEPKPTEPTPTEPKPTDPTTPGNQTKLIEGSSGADVINGTGTADLTIKGYGGDDVLRGKAGNDVLYGHAGNDSLVGNDGDDTLDGGIGDDRLLGGAGNDVLDGGDGRDLLNGDAGDDEIYGGAGNDNLFGSAGDDQISGDEGNDNAQGGIGNDLIDGGTGDDRLFGGTGNDVLLGGAGRDMLQGDAGNDRLYGGDGDDVLRGGAGDDILDGGAGGDMMLGGAGADVFVISPSDKGSFDNVHDFSRAEGDRIDLSQALDATATVANLSDYVDIRQFGSGMMQLRVDYDGLGKAHAPVLVAQIFGATSTAHVMDAIAAGTFETIA